MGVPACAWRVPKGPSVARGHVWSRVTLCDTFGRGGYPLFEQGVPCPVLHVGFADCLHVVLTSHTFRGRALRVRSLGVVGDGFGARVAVPFVRLKPHAAFLLVDWACSEGLG